MITKLEQKANFFLLVLVEKQAV